MSSQYRAVWPLVILLGLVGLLWRGLALHPQQIPSAVVGHPLPPLALQTLSQQPAPWQRLRGQVFLLHVFATWCATCQHEQPFLLQLQSQQQLPIIGLVYHDRVATVQAWLNHYGNPYRWVAVDPEGTAAIELGVYGTPETFIIDAQGIVRYQHIGLLNARQWPQLAKQIEAARRG